MCLFDIFANPRTTNKFHSLPRRKIAEFLFLFLHLNFLSLVALIIIAVDKYDDAWNALIDFEINSSLVQVFIARCKYWKIDRKMRRKVMLEENSFRFWKDNSIESTLRASKGSLCISIYIYIYICVCVKIFDNFFLVD